jgi:hypothetical protein
MTSVATGVATGLGSSVAAAKDWTVTIAPITDSSGSVGTALAVMGIATDVKAGFKRLMISTKAAADIQYSDRAIAWDKGTFSITGFMLLTGTISLNAIFAAGSHSYVTASCGTTGEQFAFTVSNQSVDVNISEGKVTESSFSGETVGIPQYAPAGGSLAAMTLN